MISSSSTLSGWNHHFITRLGGKWTISRAVIDHSKDFMAKSVGSE